MTLSETFTSTGHKFFAHEEAMAKLRNGKGQPIVTHVMLTDVCNHSCAFCSVQARAGDSLEFYAVMDYLDILMKYGLKAVILSGGGNPILYKCKKTGKTFNDVVDAIHGRGLEIGLITNGMPLINYLHCEDCTGIGDRKSWKTVRPETLDKLTWVRISMSGLDHPEREVYVPDIDPSKTTLGFSYVGHDLYTEPADPHHGKVSRPTDLLSGDICRAPTLCFEERFSELLQKIGKYVREYRPKYVRLLPNCLEPELIARRCRQLQNMADIINKKIGETYFPTEQSGVMRQDQSYAPVFVQYKPPVAPKACYLGYVHPVLNCDGYVLPCDSCCLNESSGHKLGEAWRICHWSEIGKLYEQPVRSLIKDPSTLCPGCVFTHSNEILGGVVDGSADLTPLPLVPEHVNFV